MNNFIIYSLETAISLALFYSAYWLFLKNETFFKLNRFYLMFSVVMSLTLPLLNITTALGLGKDSLLSKYLVSPVKQYEQRIENIDKNILYGNEMALNDGENRVGHIKEGTDHIRDAYSNPNQTITPNTLNKSDSDKKTNWLTIALVIYFIGVALFLIRFVANFIWITGYALKHKPQRILGMKVVRYEKNISPFSFLNLIFINHKAYPEDELVKIISHEQVHIKQKHSFDLILFELLLAFQWFNPFVWLYKRAVKITHEYLADRGTLDSGVDLSSYHVSLLNQVLGENNFELASNYNVSIKKRITMMMKKRSTRLSTMRLIIALPILLLLFTAFACNIDSPKEAKNHNSEKNKALDKTDSVIKKVDVSVEYLKLLEGNYIATNEPGPIRKIRFTVVLGSLMGNDNGYRYKLVPVGEGKFINPDDKASLVFDTKDKNAITLLLFEKINLRKIKSSEKAEGFPKKSIAFSIANVIEKDGVQAALTRYKEIKDSTDYSLDEGEMNFVGYELLDSRKTKESAVIFKLNTEAFPNSFSVYDSYGDALMALGDKTLAEENYKKSLKINLGCKNAIKRLKELGVNTDALTKTAKVSTEYLKLLEGDYLSTNQPNWMRWIKFVVDHDTLVGLDNGYRYKLLPVAEGKFINPDDGASLVFDTKDKNAISLLLFGKINLKKTKLSKEPNANLKDYAGVYLPSKKDTILSSMEIVCKDNKLYRFIGIAPLPANRNIELQLVGDNTFFYADNSGRSIEFIVNDKKQVTGCLLRRSDGTFNLSKQK